MPISLIYHSILLVTSPVSQSQLVQWYISYVAIFEYDFFVYLGIDCDIGFVVFQPIGCLDRIEKSHRFFHLIQ